MMMRLILADRATQDGWYCKIPNHLGCRARRARFAHTEPRAYRVLRERGDAALVTTACERDPALCEYIL